MSRLKALIPAALIAMGTAAPAMAQVVGSIGSLGGDVVVTRGSTNYAAQGNGSLMGGDCVTALANSSSVISLANGCSFTVAPGQSVVINAATSNCASAFSAQSASCYTAPIGGVSSNVGLASSGSVGSGVSGGVAGASAATIAGLPILPVVVGGLVLAGAVVAVTDSDDEPTSP